MTINGVLYEPWMFAVWGLSALLALALGLLVHFDDRKNGREE